MVGANEVAKTIYGLPRGDAPWDQKTKKVTLPSGVFCEDFNPKDIKPKRNYDAVEFLASGTCFREKSQLKF